MTGIDDFCTGLLWVLAYTGGCIALQDTPYGEREMSSALHTVFSHEPIAFSIAYISLFLNQTIQTLFHMINSPMEVKQTKKKYYMSYVVKAIFNSSSSRHGKSSPRPQSFPVSRSNVRGSRARSS